jgi:hypothetical protein
MEFKEFDTWDVDNSSSKIIIMLEEKNIVNFDVSNLLTEFGLTMYEDGELQRYMYSESMSGLELFENKYSYEIFRNQFESGDDLIACLDQFNFEYVWYLDANELKFVSENLEDDKAMIDELLATNKFAIICEVCHTED